MVIGNIKDLESKAITMDGAKNSSMKVLVSSIEGWEDYVMRVVEVDEDGYTPKHSHPWPHINYMIDGEGELLIDEKINKVSAGSYAFVPSGATHQFRNSGKNMFRFICIVPKIGHK